MLAEVALEQKKSQNIVFIAALYRFEVKKISTILKDPRTKMLS